MLLTRVNLKNLYIYIYIFFLHVEFTYEEYTNSHVQNVGPQTTTHMWLLNEKLNNMDKKLFFNLNMNQSQWG
jgi:hypothetical protein